MRDDAGPATRWIIEGTVQGVGYRYFTTRLAQRLGVQGWVRNLDDGTVEVVAFARSEVLRTFRARLREGPRHGRVTGISESVVDPEMPDRFEVRY